MQNKNNSSLKHVASASMLLALALFLGAMLSMVIKPAGGYDINTGSGNYSVTTTGESQIPPNPNILINGGLDVWQRTTDSTTVESTVWAYVPDRFAIKTDLGTLAHAKRGTLIRTGGRSKYNLELDGATTVTSGCGVIQRIEAAYYASVARMLTFSCYLYNNNLTSAAIVSRLYLDTADAADNFGAFTTRNGGQGQALQTAAAGAWTKLSDSVDCSAFTNLANGLQVRLWLPPGSLDATSKYVCLSELKLEQGSVATPYPVEDIGVTMAKCQRYYRKYGGNFGTVQVNVYYAATASATGIFTFIFDPPMRITPVGTKEGTWGVLNSPQPSVASQNSSLALVYSSPIAGGLMGFYCDSADDMITFSAEL